MLCINLPLDVQGGTEGGFELGRTGFWKDREELWVLHIVIPSGARNLPLRVLCTTSSFRRKSESRWGVLLLPKRTVDSKPPLIPPLGCFAQPSPLMSKGEYKGV